MHSESASEELEALMDIMKSPDPVNYTVEQYPIRYIYQSVWDRIRKVFLPYLFLSLYLLLKDRGAHISILESIRWYYVSLLRLSNF